MTLDDIRRWQSEDEGVACMLECKKSRAHRPPFAQVIDQSYTTKCLWQQWDRLRVRNDILYREKKAGCDT